MLFRKLWRTIGQYKAQFISMTVMIALGVGVFVGFNMEWASIEENRDNFFTQTGYADYRILSETGFSEADRESIAALSGVRAAARYVSVNADITEREGDSVALTVTTDPAVSGVTVTAGDAYDSASENGIWLSDRYAAANDVAVGDTLTLSYQTFRFSGTVRGLVKASEYLVCVRDESQLMPDYDTYGFAYIAPVFYRRVAGTAFYPQIRVLCDQEKTAFTEDADAALARTLMILSKEESAAYAQSQGEVEEGQTMGTVLPVLFLLIAVLTMVTTMHRLTAQEKVQIGTLKALGFPDRRIRRHYTAYALMIGLIGSVFGFGLGYGIAAYIMDPGGMMGTYFDFPTWRLALPWFCLAVVGGMLALLTLIGYLSVRQILRGTAAEALRPYTPKAVKPLAVERTRWFHRLSFGTRWNLRDSLRHKSRSAMSLVGVVGCMILTVGSLGMRDTMAAFLDLYYHGAMQYQSRIYLSETADDAQRKEVAARYDGDTGAQISVQLEDKAVALEVYDVTHGLLKFPAKDGGYTELSDDGAYVCLRLAEEFGLSPGDSVTVSPYGTTEHYTLRIAGLVRSVTESMVITPAYAENLRLPYTVSSVYTAADKADIAPDDTIKTVQSRQKIMDSFDVFLELMNTMIAVLVAGALLLGVVVLYNLGVMSYTERYREMATLKVLGFRNRKIGQLLIDQNLWLSVVGVLIGLPAGVAVLDYLLKALAGEYEMRLTLSVQTVAISVLLTVGVSLLVSVMVSRKNRKIDMVEALKGAE